MKTWSIFQKHKKKFNLIILISRITNLYVRSISSIKETNTKIYLGGPALNQ
jgi:type III secretory pathway lipoprotein EscJ